MSALLKFVRRYAMVWGVGVLVCMCGNWFQVVWGVFGGVGCFHRPRQNGHLLEELVRGGTFRCCILLGYPSYAGAPEYPKSKSERCCFYTSL